MRMPQFFCEITTLDLSYVVPVKATVEIWQNFVAFSEYMNFKSINLVPDSNPRILCQQQNDNFTGVRCFFQKVLKIFITLLFEDFYLFFSKT